MTNIEIHVSYYLMGDRSLNHFMPFDVYLLALSDLSNTTFFAIPTLHTGSDSRRLTNQQHSYQFNPHLGREETITNILVKSLTVFPSPDFSLCLALLPPHVLAPNPAANSLAEAVQKLNTLHSQLIGASYDQFWSSLDGDDLYADLIADVQGFEELMRVRQAVVISQTMQSVDRAVLESWLNLNGEAFDKFVKEVCGWTVEGSTVSIPLNKENEARGTVVRENVKFDRKFWDITRYNREAKD